MAQNHRIATQELKGEHINQSFAVDYAISAEITRGKESVTVKFMPQAGSVAGGLFDLQAIVLP